MCGAVIDYGCVWRHTCLVVQTCGSIPTRESFRTGMWCVRATDSMASIPWDYISNLICFVAMLVRVVGASNQRFYDLKMECAVDGLPLTDILGTTRPGSLLSCASMCSAHESWVGMDVCMDGTCRLRGAHLNATCDVGTACSHYDWRWGKWGGHISTRPVIRGRCVATTTGYVVRKYKLFENLYRTYMKSCNLVGRFV
jgi:hypothetical protein